LHDAASQGDIERVKQVIAKGTNVNERLERGTTALLLAANKGHLNIVKFLIDNGANLNLATDWGATPLINASAQGHADIVRLLLHNGADTKAKLQSPVDRSGRTALMIVAAEGYEDIVEIILEFDKTVSPNERREAFSLLEKSGKNRTIISGVILETSENFIRVEALGSHYRFTIQTQTKILDENGRETSLSEFQKGDIVSVAIRHDKVMEITKGGLRFEPKKFDR
jgi:ankyrin repeat protein